MPQGGNFGHFIIWLVQTFLNVYTMLILVRALISWFSPNPYNRLYQMLIRATEPVLAPIRRIVPLQGIDISPLIAILLIDFVVKRLLIGFLSSIFL
ncbi:MAG: YggT family protein [Candidatus Cloacimonadaceae bacterium]